MITLRSGKEVGNVAASKGKKVIDNNDVVKMKASKGDSDVINSAKGDVEGVKKNKKEDAIPKDDEPKVDFNTLPFPQRFIRRTLDKQFGKFLNYLNEITNTIPFMDAIKDIPIWGKFMKDIINHKSKLEEYGLVSLIKESKAMYSKSPPKLKDLGCFTIPCVIGGTQFDKALCD